MEEVTKRIGDLTAAVEGRNMCAYHVPSLSERLWNWIGFRYHHHYDVPIDASLTGWLRTDVYFRFGFLDRMRLLLTGKLRVHVTTHMDTPSPREVKSVTDWHIVAPIYPLRGA